MKRKKFVPQRDHYSLVCKRAWRLCDLRINAAYAEAAQIILDWENVDFNELDEKIREVASQGFPEREETFKTVAHVPSAQGNFKW